MGQREYLWRLEYTPEDLDRCLEGMRDVFKVRTVDRLAVSKFVFHSINHQDGIGAPLAVVLPIPVKAVPD